MKRTRVLLLASALLLSACGRSPTLPERNVAYVTVSVATGAEVSLTITGADGEVHPIDPSGKVQLAPGTYTLTGEPYKADGYTYAAVPQTVVVKAGQKPKLSVEYTAITGAMVVEVGADGNAVVEESSLRYRALAAEPVTSVTVTGPGGFSQTLTTPGTHKLEDLTPGTYNITGPNAQTTGVTVTAGQTTQSSGITLSGVAQLGFSGLPDGVVPVLRLQSSKGATFRIPAGNVVPNLTPGSYVLRSMTDPKSGGLTYHAEPVTFDVRVGETSLPTLQFAAIDGRITLVLGSVSGLTPATTLSGPDGFTQTFTLEGEVTLDYLVPGQYSLSAAGASDGAYQYEPLFGAASFTLAAGQTLQASATYRAVTGNLVASTTGLPQGASATLSLQAAGGTSVTLPEGGPLRDLAPGNYLLSGADVSAGGFTYRATPVSVDIQAGQTRTVALSYAATDAKLALSIVAPGGLGPQVTLRGPAGYERSFTQAGALAIEHLSPGAYSLSAASGSDGTYQYAPTVSSPAFTLSAGNSASASVSYAATTGNVVASSTGLPQGASATLSLQAAAGTSVTLPASGQLRDLAPGSYTLTGTEVSAGGFRYRASSVSVQVVAGQTKTPSLSYAAIDGRLTLSIAAVSGLTPSVTLRGPGGFERTFTQAGDVTLEHLGTGAYTLSANEATDGTFQYAPTVSSPSLDLAAGSTAQASVSYQATTGVLDIQVSGLPAGRSVELSGPGGQSFTVQHGSELRDLAPGTYSLSTVELTDGGWRYRPATSGLAAEAVAGQRVTLSLTFGREDVAAPSAVSLQASATDFEHGAPVTLSASASDNDRVASFELYEGLARVDTQAASASGTGYAASFSLAGVSEGEHTYSVVAVDAAGLRESSAPVVVTVKPAPPVELNHAPIVAAPIADQVYVRGRTFTLAAGPHFSDEDGDALTLSASSDAPGIASVSMSSGAVVVSTLAVGTARVTVTADDGRGGVVTTSFTVTVGPATLFISEYLDAKDGRVALELFAIDESGSGQMVSGYTLELRQWNTTTQTMQVIALPLMESYPNMAYIVIDSTFYDFFDVTNAYYYNDELYFSPPGRINTALVLKKDGQVMDVLGDPSDSARDPILPQGGTLVRKPGVGLGRTSFVAEEWTTHPKGSFQFIGAHTP